MSLEFIAPIEVVPAHATPPNEAAEVASTVATQHVISPKVGATAGVATVAEAAATPSVPRPLQSSSSSSSAVIAVARQHMFGIAAGVIAVLVVLVAAGVGVYSLLHRLIPKPFQKFTIAQVTNSGKVALAAISPDGRYVLSVIDDNGTQSLWLRNVPTGSDTQVIAPSASYYASLAFSPDGNYIYFRKTRYATAAT